MENFYYNILWIDDEHEDLLSTKGRAKRHGIKLIPFKSANAGMRELEDNYPFYDGVLFDAKILENENDEKGSDDTFNVHRAKERLLQLDKQFEIFILTGQAEAYNDKTFNKAFLKVYKKGNDDVMDKLFQDIKEAADKQKDTQIRKEHKKVFEVCTEQYIGENASKDVLFLLKVEDFENTENLLNTLRKIVEDLIIAFYKFDLIPLEFVSPNVALKQSSIFLAGQKQHEKTDKAYKQYKHLEETHLPRHIADTLKYILTIIQPASHRSAIDQHLKTMKTPYLFKSLLNQLFEIVVWFKTYIDSNPKKNNWIKENTKEDTQSFVEGEVINMDPQRSFAFLKPHNQGENLFIPPTLIQQHHLYEGIKIRAEIEEYNDDQTQETKTRAKNIEIL